MISRGDILMLGISAGVIGSLTGGLLLYAGMALVASGANVGWLMVLPAVLVAATIGWIMGRRLAAQLPPA
jgi:hypothetical protein